MPPDEPLPLGETFAGAYRPVRILGSGGMGVVYLAEVDLERFDWALLVAHRERGRGGTREAQQSRRVERLELWRRRSREELLEVVREKCIPNPGSGLAALKVLTRPRQIHRFEAEWQGLVAVDHPNLIAVYGGGVAEDATSYYSMEYVPDPIPAERLPSALSLTEKLQVVGDAARGLAALHERGLIHRDVKVSNLIVRREDGVLRTKVTDLGLGKDQLRSDPLTATREVLGTPNYMAPEQFRASREVDARSDVYSLGGVLYALLAGRMPYEDLPVLEMARAVLEGTPPAPIGAPGVPEEIERLVRSMMATAASDRPASMVEVVASVESVLARSVDETRQSGPRPAVGALPTPATATPAPEPTPAAEPPPRTASVRRTREWPRFRARSAAAFVAVLAAVAAGRVVPSLAAVAAPAPAAPPPPAPQPPPGVPGSLPDLGLEAARERLRADVRLAVLLAEIEQDYRRAQGELAALGGRAGALGLEDEIAEANAGVAAAEEEAFAAFERDLATPGGESLASRRLLFPESRSIRIDSALSRRPLDPPQTPPDPPPFPQMLARALALAAERRYQEAWSLVEASAPDETDARTRLSLLRLERLAEFDRLAEAGTPLDRRLELARQAAPIARLWAMAEDRTPGLLDAWLETPPEGLDELALAPSVAAEVETRFQRLRVRAASASSAPGPFLDAVHAFAATFERAPRLVAPYSSALAAWDAAGVAARVKGTSLRERDVIGHFAYGEGERRRGATVRDANGPVPEIHDQDLATRWQPGREKATVWIQFADGATRIARIELDVASGRIAYWLYSGDIVGARDRDELLAAEGTATPDRRTVRSVQGGLPTESRIWTLVLEGDPTIDLAEVQLVGSQHLEEAVVALFPETPLRPGQTARVRALARLTYDPICDLSADPEFQVGWRSDAWHVAVVDSAGVVTAIGPGEARITTATGTGVGALVEVAR